MSLVTTWGGTVLPTLSCSGLYRILKPQMIWSRGTCRSVACIAAPCSRSRFSLSKIALDTAVSICRP